MIHPLDPALTAQATAEIANYKRVLTEDFDVPENVFFGTLAISKSELDSFFAANPGATSVRIYFSKKTDDPLVKDYELCLVPCMEVTDSNGTYYQDRLEIAPGELSKIIMAACRIPPGCTFGGALNPNP